MASTEVEKNSSQTVDPAEEPSAEWGWHGEFPKARQVAGWFTVFACLIMLVGNHQGILSGGSQPNAADIWLMTIAAGIAIPLVSDIRRQRRSWRHG